MSARCQAITNCGRRCKFSNQCHIHTITGECGICMESMTRKHSETTICKHTFHKKCLNEWRKNDGVTCPMCRFNFDAPNFEVTLHIKNNWTNNSINNIPVSHENVEDIFDRFDLEDASLLLSRYPETSMTFDMNNISDLSTFLDDIGFGFSNIDTSILNAESVA